MAHDKHRRAEAPTSPEDVAKPSKSATPQVVDSGARRKDPKTNDDPEDYSDPICVCEPEPYWQEVAERLERDSHASK